MDDGRVGGRITEGEDACADLRLLLCSTCSYEALGLAASLNPIASGGAERTVGSHTEGAAKTKKETEERTPGSTGANGVRKGFGKIIRDREGKIVDVEIGDENEEEEEMTGADSEDVLDGLADSEVAGWVGLGSDRRKGSGQEREERRVVQGMCIVLCRARM